MQKMRLLCGHQTFRHFTAMSSLVLLSLTMRFWTGTEGRVTGNSVQGNDTITVRTI